MTAKDLKNALLQEAVQGRLVPQIASEGNAKDLLEEIRKEKSKLIEEKKLKKEKPLPEITEDEIPFDIPESWCWSRLGEIAEVIRGLTFSQSFKEKQQNTSLVLRGGNIDSSTEKLIFSDNIYVDSSIIKEQQYLRLGDILIVASSGTKTSVGKSTLIDSCLQNVSFGGFMMLIRPSQYILPLYLSIQIKLYRNKIISETAGYISNITNSILNNLLIPLPSLAEQKRIVVAIEKFMPLIEEYGKKETELKAFNEQIGTLTKKAILQEAVQGKLVPQIAAEGKAKDLLEEIKKEKAKLIKEVKIKKEKPLPEITEDEIPFEIPENWCWCRLGEIVYNNGQKTPDKEFSYIDIGSIDNLHQKLNDKENFVSPKQAPSRARKIVKKGDIIYATVRPYLHNMCIIDKDFEKEPIASTGFAVLACYPQINNQYLFYYLLSPSFDNYANDTENSKGVAYPAINDDKLYKGVVPLPPLAEQKRIVAAIEKILPLCEKLGE